jgi:hypothetical protein
MPKPSTELTRRLAFVRYLYDLAAEQSRKPEPMAMAAVLTWHDAVEMFLQIVAEHYQVSVKKTKRSWTIGPRWRAKAWYSRKKERWSV